MDPNEKIQLDDITFDDVIAGDGVDTVAIDEIEKPVEKEEVKEEVKEEKPTDELDSIEDEVEDNEEEIEAMHPTKKYFREMFPNKKQRMELFGDLYEN